MGSRPRLTGFCTPGNAADSHARCTGDYLRGPSFDPASCECACHQAAPDPAPDLIEEDTVLEDCCYRCAGCQRDVCNDDQPKCIHDEKACDSCCELQHIIVSITEPGLVLGMSDDIYHADPVPSGSLSSTFARLLTDHVPAKADEIRRNRKPTKAMNLGKAAHAHALGAGPELIVWEYDGRTKEGKAERAELAPLLATEAAVAVTAAERDQILGMVTALRAHPEVVTILDECESEVSGFWSEGGVWLRARYDLLGGQAAWDYKTCQDASRRGFSKTMGTYGYHQQAELYGRGLKALGHPAGKSTMRFICQETTAPYLVQIHTPDEEAMSVARELNDRAIRLYAQCVERGTWPGYEQLHAEPVPLPAYYFFDHEEHLDMPAQTVELKL